MGRSSVGLDIGTRAVTVAEVQGRSLTRFGRALLPDGAVDHGEIHDPAAVATTINSLWKKLGLASRTAHIGIANRHVVVRMVEMPPMSRNDLASAIRFQAQDHIPIPLAEAVMDFEVIDEVERGESRVQRVLVVAAERNTIQPILTTLQEAKIEALSVELSAYPLARCFRGNGGGATAIVDVGAGVTNVVVISSGKIQFTRILPSFGGDEFTKAVMERLGVSRDDAEALKRRAAPLLRTHVPTPAAVPAVVGAGMRRSVAERLAQHSQADGGSPNGSVDSDEVESRVAPQTPAAQLESAVEAIDPVLDRFITEIRGSIDFYAAQADAAPLERVVLTGGGALMGGIAERLFATMNVPVEQGHVFENVPLGKLKVSPEDMAIAEPFMSVAVGLALAEGGS